MLTACLFALFVYGPPLIAQDIGGLTVTPTRIVFEGREKSAEVTLVNTTSNTGTYRISFKNMRMLEDGSYADISTPENGEKFADEMIRYSPRQVVLKPGESQTIRLQLRKPADLLSGEYRSHLLIQSLPPETAGRDIEQVDLKEGELAVRILTTYAVTIPVIVIDGNLTASVTISDMEVRPPQDTSTSSVLTFALNRIGDRSVAGEVIASFKSSLETEEQVVGLLGNISVLSPYPRRTVKLALKKPDGSAISNGTLNLIYRARAEEGGTVLANAKLQIP